MDLFQNPYQVIRFIVDNNPAAVQANLSGLGLLSGFPQDLSPDDIYNQVVDLYETGQNDFVRQVLAVPYIDAPGSGIGEYTGGYRQELEEGQTIEIFDTNNRALPAAALVALIGGIASIGAGFFGWQASQEQSEAAQSQVDAALIYQQASESRKILGLDPIAFSAIVIVVAAIVITLIIVISRRK